LAHAYFNRFPIVSRAYFINSRSREPA